MRYEYQQYKLKYDSICDTIKLKNPSLAVQIQKIHKKWSSFYWFYLLYAIKQFYFKFLVVCFETLTYKTINNHDVFKEESKYGNTSS